MPKQRPPGKYGPRQVITCLWAYVDSKDPDQPAHPLMLISAGSSGPSLSANKIIGYQRMYE